MKGTPVNAFKYRIRTFFKYRDLSIELVSRDLKLKYRRSFLGYLWGILNPLLIMIVMTVVFSAMFKRNIENYPVYLLSGRLIFECMRVSTTHALKSVTGNQALLKKTYIPKYIFTFAKVTSCMIDTVLSLGAMIIVMIATRSPFYPTFLLAPIVIFKLYLFCLGLSFLLAELEVFFRDIEYIYHAVCTAWMYLSALFYPLESLPNLVQMIIKIFNPMYYYIAAFRDIVLYGRIPGPRIIWGGWIWAIAMLIIGVVLFQKNQDRFILYL